MTHHRRPRRVDRLDRHPDPRRRARPSPTGSRSWPSAAGLARSSCWSTRPRRAGPRSWPSPTTRRAAELEAARAAGHRGRRRARRPGRHRRRGRRVRQRRGRLRRARASPWRRCRPASAWPWPTRSRSSPPARWCSAARGDPGRRAGAGRLRALRRPHVPARPTTAPSRRRPDRAHRRGGPFRGRTRAELAEVTDRRRPGPPDVEMGPKITVDSSTLMNKGLEVIEAHELFGVALRPTSTWWCTRSRSSTRWSSSPTAPPSPSCRCPTCACPSATPWPTPTASAPPFGRHRLDRAAAGSTSSRPTSRPSPASAWPTRPAGPAGRPRPALNAANEVAVEAFLDGRIRWVDIPDVLEAVLDRHDGGHADTARRRARRRPPAPDGAAGISTLHRRRGSPRDRPRTSRRPTPPTPAPSTRGARRRRGRPARQRRSGWSILAAARWSWPSSSAAGRCLVVILGVVVMIFLHELGHYLTASRAG